MKKAQSFLFVCCAILGNLIANSHLNFWTKLGLNALSVLLFFSYFMVFEWLDSLENETKMKRLI